MGKVISRINKQFYRFNAENRAHREISREKPTVAPRHPTEEKAMKDLLQETEYIKEQQLTKDPVLDDYLKKVFVVSEDPIEQKRKKPSEKGMLPLSRSRPEETELGYHEPQIIPKGKITLQQVMKLLADNQSDPQLYNETKISHDYELSKEDTANLLEYFSSFKVHIKEEPLKISGKENVLSYFGASGKVKSLPGKSET